MSVQKFILITFALLLLASSTMAFTCPTNDGLYPDPADPTCYWECGYGGKAVHHKCPMKDGRQLYWNDKKKWCDFPENISFAGTYY